MNYLSVRVKLPNNKVRRAHILSETKNGYRSARVSTPFGKAYGRVTARHGFRDDRVLPFEVEAADAWMMGDIYVS